MPRSFIEVHYDHFDIANITLHFVVRINYFVPPMYNLCFYHNQLNYHKQQSLSFKGHYIIIQVHRNPQPIWMQLSLLHLIRVSDDEVHWPYILHK